MASCGQRHSDRFLSREAGTSLLHLSSCSWLYIQSDGQREPWDAGHWQSRAERSDKDWQTEQEADPIHNAQCRIIVFILSLWGRWLYL